MALSRGDVEAVASRVVELLQGVAAAGGRLDPSGRLVDAATLARLLGVSRATVYANADQLGAIRLGKGKRARLRFDPVRLAAASPRAEPGRAAPWSARRRGSVRTSQVTERLLPIRGVAPGAKRRRRGAQSPS